MSRVRSRGYGLGGLASAVHWPMRKMTNSAGWMGAMPMMQMSRPLSRSFWVMVVRSHFTKKASSGLMPRRAPVRHSLKRKLGWCCGRRAQRCSPLGSKTTHWMPLFDGVLEVVEVASDVDVFPVGVAGDGAGSPDEDAAAGEDAEGVDAGVVEGGGVGVGESRFE